MDKLVRYKELHLDLDLNQEPSAQGNAHIVQKFTGSVAYINSLSFSFALSIFNIQSCDITEESRRRVRVMKDLHELI